MGRASSKRTPARNGRAGDKARKEAETIGAWLVLLLLVPRLVRLFYPQAWIEDDFYLESAYLVSIGMRPYIDFVHPHFPLLEWTAGAYLRLFGASHFSIEVLNESAIYVTSLLVFALGRRVAGRMTGTCAAILYATSSLVFRYHVYERECFVAPLTVAAVIVALGEGGERWSPRAGRQALALLVALGIKLTAAIPSAVLFGFAVARRRWREAAVLALEVGAGLAVLTAFCYWLYGYDFFFQTFLFHFLKGHDTVDPILTYPLQILDIEFPLVVIGCVALGAERRMNEGIALVLAMVAASYVFYGVISPTAWGHNYLEPLPYIAIVAGIGLDWMIRLGRDFLQAEEDEAMRVLYRLVSACLFVVVSLVWISPLENQNWLHGSVYGFGFMPRSQIARIATAIRNGSAPGENVIAPSFLCFQANRPELIRFPETYGVYRNARAEVEKYGFFKAREMLDREDFFNLIVKTSGYWTTQIKQAVTRGTVRVVVPDSPIQLLPLVFVPPEVLAKSGYRPVLETQYFIVWQHLAKPDEEKSR